MSITAAITLAASRLAGSLRAAGGAVRRNVRAVGAANRRFAWAEGSLFGAAALATLSLSGSWASIPTETTAASRDWNGRLNAAAFAQLTQGMSPYAVASADRILSGYQGWTPTGMTGWGVYDLSAPPSLISGRLDVEEARALNGLIAPTNGQVAAMPAFAIQSGAEGYSQALECLNQAIYYEAGFESTEGQQAVAQVVINRVRHPDYPKTVCGVVYQGSQRTTGCQFSFTCDGSLTRAPSQAAWQRSRDVAKQALAGFVYEPVGTATHYHADYVFPYWAVTLVKLKQIGAHIFYRITGPRGMPEAFNGKYAGDESAISFGVLAGGDSLTADAPSAANAVDDPVNAVPQARLVSLTIGGQTRVYSIVDYAGAPVAAASGGAQAVEDPALTGEAPVGVLVRSQRAMTPEQIREINERVLSRPANSGVAPPKGPAPDVAAAVEPAAAAEPEV